jgi:hypothetical protein
MNLLPEKRKSTKISEKEELFLQNLFENGGHVVAAAENAGYTKGSAGYLRSKLVRLKAAESLLNRVGLGREETHNHNVQALHGVVLLPAKKEIEING